MPLPLDLFLFFLRYLLVELKLLLRLQFLPRPPVYLRQAIVSFFQPGTGVDRLLISRDCLWEIFSIRIENSQ